MTDLEISKQLALAIGYNYHDVICVPMGVGNDPVIRVSRKVGRYWKGYDFDYRDWAVAGPIAERYDRFPYLTAAGCWTTWTGQDDHADTPQKAIAMAVIEGRNDDTRII